MFTPTRLAASAALCLLTAACGGGDPQDSDEALGAEPSATAQAATASTPADASLPGEVLVKLRLASDLPGVLSKHRLSLAGRFGARPIYRLKLVSGTDLGAKLSALRADPRVLIAEPNYVASSPEARKGAVWAIGKAGNYTAQWAPQAINLASAHALSKGAGIRVAVLDTGVDRNHPALVTRLRPGRDFVDGDNDPSEVGGSGRAGWGHGTHVAGLVALVAPSARIVPLRVLDPDGRGNVWAIAEALLYAADPDGEGGTDDGAHIINLSLGTTRPTRILDVVIELVSCGDDDDDEDDDDYSDPGYRQDEERCNRHHGSVVIAAAGNGASSTERQYPAAERAEGALSVAASTSASTIASFSNRGAWIQIAAPGQGLTSTVPGGGYGVWSGTSMATPLAAGVAALVLSRNPDWKPVDVTKRLEDRSARLCGTELRRIDAAGAVRDQMPADVMCL
jgi:subtilisin family serine protease